MRCFADKSNEIIMTGFNGNCRPRKYQLGMVRISWHCLYETIAYSLQFVLPKRASVNRIKMAYSWPGSRFLGVENDL
jgi:hypothetical protein